MNPFSLRPRKNDFVVVKFNESQSNPTEPALLIEYWAQQQNRVSHHESGRYQFSSILVAGSLVALGLLGEGTMTQLEKLAACFAVAAANVLALEFVLKELRWIKIHQSRL